MHLASKRIESKIEEMISNIDRVPMYDELADQVPIELSSSKKPEVRSR